LFFDIHSFVCFNGHIPSATRQARGLER
jgi:hypothetical protein